VVKTGASRDLYFYRPSYEIRSVPRIISFDGGQSKSISLGSLPDVPMFCQWSPDGGILVAFTWRHDEQVRCWLLPVRGGAARELKVDAAGLRTVSPVNFDPTCKRVLFYATAQDGQEGYFVAPVSLEQGQVTGAARRLFSTDWGMPVWAPDGSRLAVRKEGRLWFVSSDGQEWSQPSPDLVSFGDVSWSPEGTHLGFVTVLEARAILHVVAAKGGAPIAVHTWPGKGSAWDWTVDGKSVTVVADGILRDVPMAGAEGKEWLRLKDLGYADVDWLGWSPDGQRLAFHAVGSPQDRDELFAITVQDRTPRKLTTQDQWSTRWGFTWSTDGRSIAYNCEDRVKVRRAGVLYRFAADEALKKVTAEAPPAGLDAEKKPPMQDSLKRWEEKALPGATTAAEKAVGSVTTPAADPIRGPVFTDNFDNGPSKHWYLIRTTQPGLPPKHDVENGELVLTHASARLDGPDGIDWTNYVVKVRVSIKEAILAGEAVVGIQTRTTPSHFGIRNMDRYTLLIVCVGSVPSSLWLGRTYRDAANNGRQVQLGTAPCRLTRDQWCTLEFEVRGQRLRGFLDGKLVMEATDAVLAKGGIWLSAWKARAHFDDFSVRQLP
jgi:Tol biopolymer transport system component